MKILVVYYSMYSPAETGMRPGSFHRQPKNLWPTR